MERIVREKHVEAKKASGWKVKKEIDNGKGYERTFLMTKARPKPPVEPKSAMGKKK